MSLSAPSPITIYSVALQALDSSEALTEEQAVAVLCARDAVYQSLIERFPISGDRLLRIQSLDTKLRAQQERIDGAIDLAAYRSIHPNTAQRWWWHLDSDPSSHQQDRNDWFLKLLTIAIWTAILALLLDIGNRFLSVGIGVTSGIAVVLPSFLAFLKARSDLTDAGKKSIEQLLTKAGIPKRRQTRTKFVLTLVLLGGIVALWSSLSVIANVYNRQGLDLYFGGHLRQAEQHYRQAIALDSEHADAHYNLGVVYEDWLRPDEAQRFYQVAVSQGLIKAHNNLARLLIQSEDYQGAVVLLQDGLLLRNRRAVTPEQEFNLYKNLGWARLSQGHLQDAESALEKAIVIANVDKIREGLRSSAAPHCLLAQVLEKQSKASDSMQQWQKCCERGIDKLERRRTAIPEEDKWLHQAQQRLKAYEKSCPSPDTIL